MATKLVNIHWYKVVMLLALTRPSRSADLAGLDLIRRYLPEGVLFAPTKLAKQIKQDKGMADFFLPAFPHNVNLCPVETLRVYEKCTEAFREHTSKQFIATIKTHHPVSSSTIARWLKTEVKGRHQCRHLKLQLQMQASPLMTFLTHYTLNFIFNKSF